jgi:carbon-monoxide dehydrogenase large subunit
MIVEGQLHGGIVQGIGQALCENCIYDSASGQLLSGSFMDYCMPRADNIPRMTVSTHSKPSVHTPMGVKGCGEVGTIGSPAAVTNAVVDALSHYGVGHIDMPTTPNRIWSVIPKGLVTPRTASAHLITFARGHIGRVRGGALVAPIKAKDASSGPQERV